MHRIRRVEIDDVRVQVFGGAAVVTERTHGVGQFARAEYDAVIGLRIRSSGATASGVLSLLTRVVATAATLEEQRPLQLIAQLDQAGIQRGVVLSTAYWFASPVMPKVEGDEQANVHAENAWTVTEVSRFPTRLVAFCSLTPLAAYALAEFERCSAHPSVRGLKLHFANSGVDVRNSEHVEKLRRVFAAVNARRMAIIAHLWTGKGYGRADAEVFLNQILPVAPDIPIQIAHFAGAGPGYTDPALAVYAEAIAARDPRTKNLYFDVATVAYDQSPGVLQTLATRIQQVGPERVLWGTDVARGSGADKGTPFVITPVPVPDFKFKVEKWKVESKRNADARRQPVRCSGEVCPPQARPDRSFDKCSRGRDDLPFAP